MKQSTTNTTLEPTSTKHVYKKPPISKAIKEQWFIYTFLIVMAAVICFPIFWMISISVRSNGFVFSTPVIFWPEEMTFEAYIKIFTSARSMTYFVNSYLYGIIVTVISIAIGIMAGYGMSRYNFKGKQLFNFFTISTQTVPQVTLLIPFFLIMISYKLYNTPMGIIIAYISFALPYSIIMMLGYFNSVSQEIDEAARIDGASDLRTLWQIIVPITIPGIISTMIYVFILSWNEYIFITALVKSDALRTVPYGIALMKGESEYEWNTMMAMSIIGSIPVLIFYLIGQRKFIAGAAAGAVKG